MAGQNDTIKVRVVIYAEVDRSEWNAEYGTEDSTSFIREQVKATMKGAAEDAVRHLPIRVE